MSNEFNLKSFPFGTVFDVIFFALIEDLADRLRIL